ncbi:biopolymer transporter ExbD [Rubrimonas sp.]|uniref:biopolymer transporter ExbD n=1 Tax=Rubrimonas sp. TaxID=2036015 RepID=UPI002FDDF47B
MRLDPPARRNPPDIAAPMINVVFLLLIFLLMTATLAPPPPLEATPPQAALAVDRARGTPTLHVGAGGEVAFGQARGAAAVAAVLEGGAEAVALLADRDAPAATVAALAAELTAGGAVRVLLRVEPVR